MFYQIHHNSDPLKCNRLFEIKQEGDNYVIRSINRQMYLQLICESTLSPFDENGRDIKDLESTHWNQKSELCIIISSIFLLVIRFYPSNFLFNRLTEMKTIWKTKTLNSKELY